MLKTVSFGGYNKMESLALIDALNTALFMMEEDIKNVDFDEIIDNIKACKVNKVFFGGFDRSDIQVYVSQLIQKIKECYASYYGNEGPFTDFKIDFE